MFRKLFLFFRDGLSQMTVGRTLWMIVLIKLFIMFAILKVFFFPDFLKTNFKTDGERAEYVAGQLLDRQIK
jgi:hypothetical protein